MKHYPEYLIKDIEALENVIQNGPEIKYDLYLDELYGSINSAYTDGKITGSEAAFLRKKYFGL